MTMKSLSEYKCEVCGYGIFREYDYPIVWEKRFGIEQQRLGRKKILYNNSIYLIKLIINALPNLKFSWLKKLKKRAGYKNWLFRSDLKLIEKNLKIGANLFNGRKIRICENCGFGCVHPPLSEKELMDYYTATYWLVSCKILEPFENKRSEFLYSLAEKFIDFDKMNSVIEFGSASAQLSRYFKYKQPHIDISVIEPGENWQRLLSGKVNRIFNNIFEVNSAFDIFLSSHSLEHVSNFSAYFNKIIGLIDKGGYLILEVPNCIEADVIFDKANPDYCIPHTYFFTPRSFEEIAKKFKLRILLLKTFNRSYSQILQNIRVDFSSNQENVNGAWLRAVMQKEG